MISTLLLAMLPLIAMMLIGAVLAKRTSCLDGPAMNQLVSLVGLPALLLHSMQTMETSLAGLANLMLAAFAFLMFMTLFVMVCLAFSGLPVRKYLPALVNPNAAYLGLPVCVALFGPQATATVMVFSTLVQVSHFTLGTVCLTGQWHPGQLLRSPPLLALLLAVVLQAVDCTLPDTALTTLSLLASMTLPLMLLQMGASLMALPKAHLRAWQRPLWLASIRTLGGALIAVVVLSAWPMSVQDYLIFVVVAAMPVAAVSHAMAVRYDGPAEDIALVILWSLPLSLLLTALIQWLL